MLIVEDGSGLTTANSYADVEAADAYYSDRNEAAWAGIDAVKEAALIRATDYIDATYVFRSVKLDDDQALENPRYCQDGLHPSLIKATIELALNALTINLFAPITVRDVTAEKLSIDGVVTEEKTYTASGITDAFPHITRILKSIATRRGGSGTVSLTR